MIQNIFDLVRAIPVMFGNIALSPLPLIPFRRGEENSLADELREPLLLCRLPEFRVGLNGRDPRLGVGII